MMCGNLNIPCGYRKYKECKRPRNFKCKQVLNFFDKNGKLKIEEQEKEL